MQAIGSNQDKILGKIVRGKKWDAETKKFVAAKFLNVLVYDVDAAGNPVITGQVKVGNRQFDQHKIFTSFRIAESSLRKVLEGQSKSCNLYWKSR